MCLKSDIGGVLEDAKIFREFVEKKRVFKFHLGLNKNLDEVRGRILATKPLPSLREAFSKLRREESKKKMMLRELSTITVSQTFSLIA